MKVKQVTFLSGSEHFAMGKTAGDRWQVMAANANDPAAARAIEIVGQEHRGDLTAKDEDSAKLLIWELDEQYERAWHAQAWRRYSGKEVKRSLSLPEPIRKARKR